MTHGLPDELARLYSLAGIRRKTDTMIEEATQKALTAGYSADRITEILTTRKYPPPGAGKEWLSGWHAAEAGGRPPTEDADAYMGFMEYLRRNG